MNAVRIERVEELRLSAGAEQAIIDLIAECFTADFAGRSFFQNRHHCRLLGWHGENLAGHLAIAYRAILLGGERVNIIGIGEVAVADGYRRQGIGTRLVDAATKEGISSRADFALLFGEATIYSRAGYSPAPNVITMTEMEGCRTRAIVREAHPYFMVKPLGERQWDREASVDLAGFAF